MPAWLLKFGATAVTMLAAAGSAGYVGAHVKSGAAPLHPSVVASATHSTAQAGRLTLTPKVRTSNVGAVTSTYAS
jgi:hypothetical protein